MLAKQNDPDIFKRARCGICKSRVPERLCDFVIEYRRPAFFRNYEDFTEKELREINEQKTKKVSDQNGISGVHSNKSRL